MFLFLQIDNSLWSLPIVLSNAKLNIFQSGRSAVIETSFGLTIRYDWDHNLVVSLSDSYASKTCGLCGNFNGNPNDDFATPSGVQAGEVVAFGSSWKVPGMGTDPQCRDDCVGGCGSCDNNLMNKYEGIAFCGLITKENGPFSKCHPVVNTQAYIESCKYDLCMGGGLRQFLCNALEAYVDACQDAGIQVQDWRTMAKCCKKQKLN